MKALQEDQTFLQLADRFVLIGVTTVAQLLTTSNNAYFLLLDPSGKERMRLMDEGGETGGDRKNPKQLSPGDVTKAMQAALAIEAPGLSGEKLLLRLLGDPRLKVRRDAARLAGRRTAALPQLLSMLEKETDAQLVSTLVWSLRRFGERARDAIPRLQKLVRGTGSVTVRTAALHSLASIDRGAIVSLPTYKSALRDQSGYVALAAARVLSELRPPPVEAVAPLMEAWLRTDDNTRRLYVARALGAIGPAASAAVPLLEAATKGEHRQLAHAATRALEKIRKAR